MSEKVPDRSVVSVSGAAVPLLLASISQDPAQSSAIVLTTITDLSP